MKTRTVYTLDLEELKRALEGFLNPEECMSYTAVDVLHSINEVHDENGKAVAVEFHTETDHSDD